MGADRTLADAALSGLDVAIKLSRPHMGAHRDPVTHCGAQVGISRRQFGGLCRAGKIDRRLKQTLPIFAKSYAD